MKYILYLAGAVLIMSACNNATKTATTDSAAPAKAAVQPTVQATYSGDFSGNPIYITINYAKGKNLAGYNTHKGLRRNLSGDVQPEGDGWLVTLKEPGDHPFDGFFTLHFNRDYTQAKGTWQPARKDSLTEKKLTLNRINGTDRGEIPHYYVYEHGEISFEDDGSCKLQYYPAITDSTFEEQMQIVRGTWKKMNDTIFRVNWVMNERFGKKTSDFTVKMTIADDHKYVDSVMGEGFTFYTAP